MSSRASSVRPGSSKQEWGTILEPEFGLGYQRLSPDQVEQSVDRLYYIPEHRHRIYDVVRDKDMSRSEIDNMVQRLSNSNKAKTVDAKRTQKHSIYNNMGVVNSYAWKGYN